MAHVFISYAHVDFEFVENLQGRLEKAGFEVWVDQERLRAGEDWREEIDAALRDCFALIIVITPESMASKYVMYEWSFAWGAAKKVIPILLKAVENEIHPRLDKRQYLDFTHRIRPWDELTERLKKIRKEYDPRQNIVTSTSKVPLYIVQAVRKLDSYKPSERRMAIQTLGEAGQDSTAREALATATSHTLQDVRIQAALMLAQITDYKDERSLPGLFEGLQVTSPHDEKKVWRTSAISSLAKMGSIAVEGLIDALSNESQYIRLLVIKALGSIGDIRAIPVLIEAIKEQDEDICRNAIWALGQTKHTSALPRLLSILARYLEKPANYGFQRIMETVIEALGNIGDEIAIPNLIKALDYGGKELWTASTRCAAAFALGKIGGASGVTALVAKIRSQNDEKTKAAAIVALQWARTTQAVNELIPLLSDSSLIETPQELENRFERVCNLAASSLWGIATPEALAAVEEWQRSQKS